MHRLNKRKITHSKLYLTVSELSDEISVTEQAVYQCMQKSGLVPMLGKVDQKTASKIRMLMYLTDRYDCSYKGAILMMKDFPQIIGKP